MSRFEVAFKIALVVAFALVLVYLSAVHWIAHEPDLQKRAGLIALSVIAEGLLIYMATSFAEARGDPGRRLLTIMVTLAILATEGIVLYWPVKGFYAGMDVPPALTVNRHAREADAARFRALDQEIAAAQEVGGERLQIAILALDDTLVSEGVTDGIYGPVTRVAAGRAKALAATKIAEAEADVALALEEEAALRAWGVRPALVVAILMAIGLSIRYVLFGPGKTAPAPSPVPLVPDLPRLAFNPTSGDYALGKRTLTLEELRGEKWAPSARGAAPGLAPKGHCWQPFPSAARPEYYVLRRLRVSKKRGAGKSTSAQPLKLVHSA